MIENQLYGGKPITLIFKHATNVTVNIIQFDLQYKSTNANKKN